MNAVPSENEILLAIQSVPHIVDDWESTASWTDALKRAIGALGSQYEWGVCASDSKRNYECEWLFDLTLYASPGGMLKELFLVLESEWVHGYEPIRHDFEKLLIARARYKVMVFESEPPERDDIFEKLIGGVAHFSAIAPGEVYFLAAWSPNSQRFVVKRVEVVKQLSLSDESTPLAITDVSGLQVAQTVGML